MKKKNLKRVITMAIAFALLLTMGVHAADFPFYLDPSWDWTVDPLGNSRPIEPGDNSNTLFIPGNQKNFDYSFKTTRTQYSDFLICSRELLTDLCMEIYNETGESTVEIYVYQTYPSKQVFSSKIYLSEGADEIITVPYSSLTVNAPYYIMMRTSSVVDLSGTVRVYGE